MLITGLCLYGTPVGIKELTFIRDSRRSYRTYLIQDLYLYGLMFIQDSRRSYKTYSYTEVLVSTTELILILRSIYLSYGTYTGLTELIRVFQSTNWYFGSYTCITELIHVFQILYM